MTEALLALWLLVAIRPRVRPAKSADCVEVTCLAADDEGASPTLTWWRNRLTDGTSRWYVLEVLSHVIGVVGVLVREPSNGLPRRGHVTMLTVQREWRRCGGGSKLLGAALRSLEADDHRCISLHVRASNAAALALYVRHGFRQHARLPAYYHDPAEAGLLCVRWTASLPR